MNNMLPSLSGATATNAPVRMFSPLAIYAMAEVDIHCQTLVLHNSWSALEGDFFVL